MVFFNNDDAALGNECGIDCELQYRLFDIDAASNAFLKNFPEQNSILPTWQLYIDEPWSYNLYITTISVNWMSK